MAALKEADELAAPHWQGTCQLVLGQIAAGTGDDDRAQEYFCNAFETFEALGVYHYAAEALEGLISLESSESSTVQQYRERGAALLSNAPKEVRKRHESP